ncbi:choice-of-anchor P family protein [Amycolatopsis anabasis]|uniref:choice-of-anchor P family protein n=1 Tax=Amycolatopsis anabasis TaxID=1840409 RepID=UPI00131E4C9A|nr:choice-of-anchor P family protein [Amycolatopsis anabasis]
MRSTHARRALATLGVAGLLTAVGGAPAFASGDSDSGKAYSKAELIKGTVLNQTILDPVVQEYPPGGTIEQPKLNIGNVIKLELTGLGVSATGDKDKGKSQASVNVADAALTVGLPNVAEIRIKENALDSWCEANGGELKGGTTLASVAISVIGPNGVPLGELKIPFNPPPNFGVKLPGELGEVLANKQVRKDGVITVTALSINVLGQGGAWIEKGKTTCGPNIPTPEVPVAAPEAVGAAALALGGIGGFAYYRRRHNGSETS